MLVPLENVTKVADSSLVQAVRVVRLGHYFLILDKVVQQQLRCLPEDRSKTRFQDNLDVEEVVVCK